MVGHLYVMEGERVCRYAFLGVQSAVIGAEEVHGRVGVETLDVRGVDVILNQEAA